MSLYVVPLMYIIFGPIEDWGNKKSCKISYFCTAIGFFVCELPQMYYLRRAYFSNYWNLFQVLKFVCTVVHYYDTDVEKYLIPLQGKVDSTNLKDDPDCKNQTQCLSAFTIWLQVILLILNMIQVLFYLRVDKKFG